MATPDMIRYDRLIDDLASRLSPVRRLSPPLLRGLGWFALVIVVGLLLLPFVDRASLIARFSVEDLRMSYGGAALTALAAAIAAFQTSIPGRGRFWALLPLPPAVLWLGASGLGCLRSWSLPGAEPTGFGEVSGCFGFILGLSIPLSFGLLLLLLLRQAYSLRPNLTATLSGLAAAAGAATLLVLFHPHDATALDLVVHIVVVTIVVVLNRLLGGRLLNRRGT